MEPILTNKQKMLLRIAKEKQIITLKETNIIFSCRQQEQLNRLADLGYFEIIPFGKYKYTGKSFE